MAFFSFLDQKKKKDALRELAKERKKGISAEQLDKANREIHLRLLQSPFFLEAERIFSYVSMEGEVDTRIILETALQMGKRVCVPRCIPGKEHLMEAVEIHSMEELIPQTYGILEPRKELPSSTDWCFDLSLIPCVMADQRGEDWGMEQATTIDSWKRAGEKSYVYAFPGYFTIRFPWKKRISPWMRY